MHNYNSYFLGKIELNTWFQFFDIMFPCWYFIFSSNLLLFYFFKNYFIIGEWAIGDIISTFFSKDLFTTTLQNLFVCGSFKNGMANNYSNFNYQINPFSGIQISLPYCIEDPPDNNNKNFCLPLKSTGCT